MPGVGVCVVKGNRHRRLSFCECGEQARLPQFGSDEGDLTGSSLSMRNAVSRRAGRARLALLTQRRAVA